MQKQIWKNVPGYEGLYQVSNLGNVRSFYLNDVRELRKSNHSEGYLIVNLMKEKQRKTMKVHQLVAMAFLGHVPNGNTLVVDHINGDKKDNRLKNLQILTNFDNTRKKNLQILTHLDNIRSNTNEIKRNLDVNCNVKKQSSQFPGVCFFKQTGKWKAQFQRKNVRKHLGYFDTEMEAYHAYQIEKYSLAQ